MTTKRGIVRSEGYGHWSAGNTRSGLEGGNGDAEAPLMPPGVRIPALELARWLDRYVDRLLGAGIEDIDAPSRERVDLMVGLSNAAEALRASQRCDHESAERTLRSALELMRGIDLDRFALPVP
ncbi:hypothetical protein [Amycolatopsis regifaucium]|nr:hypothetical protein [Amycolatopsis regifaucium]SFJ13035.1 hypothetical protein SAMN04489731_11610 [Amycolatopsis regifaucium]